MLSADPAATSRRKHRSPAPVPHATLCLLRLTTRLPQKYRVRVADLPVEYGRPTTSTVLRVFVNQTARGADGLNWHEFTSRITRLSEFLTPTRSIRQPLRFPSVDAIQSVSVLAASNGGGERCLLFEAGF